MLNRQENTNNTDFSIFVSAPSFWVPDFINLSAWIEHAPFAFWLVNAISPNTIVELGVHYGYSYFVFCQAIQQLGLSTACYGIDTWKGDEHSGFYGEEVFLKVHAYNNQKYSGFSQLMRSTFDNATEYFLDKSIDILHIDGRHFYEDVKHDFETWLPKLSDRAIVLLHDINVKERQFGIFKFWEELRQLYPHFEFIHGHGLGVLGVGESIALPLKQLFDTNNSEQSNIRQIYSRLGNALTDRYQLAKQTELNSELLTFKEKLNQGELRLSVLSSENKQQQIEIMNLKNKLEIIQDNEENDERKRKMQELKDREILQLKNQLSITENALKQRETVIEQLSRTMRQIYSSKLWRYTLPFRKILHLFS